MLALEHGIFEHDGEVCGMSWPFSRTTGLTGLRQPVRIVRKVRNSPTLRIIEMDECPKFTSNRGNVALEVFVDFRISRTTWLTWRDILSLYIRTLPDDVKKIPRHASLH